MSSSPYDKLGRILALERDQGHRDRAVIGGLGRFLTYWEKEARREGDDARVDRIVGALSDYAGCSRDMRVQVVQETLALLSDHAATAAATVVPAEETPRTGAPDPMAGKDGHQAPAVGPVSEEDATDLNEPAALPIPEPVRQTPSRSRASRAVDASRPESSDGEGEPMGGDDPLLVSVTAIKGISTVNEKRLAGLGLATVRDLLYHFPRRHDDFGELATINRLRLGDEVTIVGVVRDVRSQRIRGGRVIVSMTLTDGTGSIEARWFNQPYMAERFKTGSEIVLSGRIEEYLGRLVFVSPEWEPLQRELLHTGRLVPVYPLSAGISGRWLRGVIKAALDGWTGKLRDPMPPSIRESAGLIDLPTAMRQMHFPDSMEALERARERLCFDELFTLQLGVLRQRQLRRNNRARALAVPRGELDEFVGRLAFQLTGAQRRAIDEILADLEQPVPMSRLLQGDVGSGKTVVALVAMLAAVRNGLQAAIMAPTAILAEQHYYTISRLLDGWGNIRTEYLIGAMPAAEKGRVQRAIAEGVAQVVVGTHALIQDAVDFDRLGLMVVDEQHRFGVSQRSMLRTKAGAVEPHMLAMSATPIPRSLALTLYGDLDITVLDEMPPQRQSVTTVVRNRGSRERIYSFIQTQIDQGYQAFIICPLVEESERTDAKAAVAEYKRLQQDIFPQRKLGLLHGRMRADEKEQVMKDFRDRRYDVLVSTAVVEVGVDVPNATVILIEGAERFGLAQLHQFRGRVGRGEAKSYCILLSDDPSEQGAERLAILEETGDGFVLAERDLEIRGPGDFFGVRQHGLPELRVARLSDMPILHKARREATALYEVDPNLSAPEHAALAASVSRLWAQIDLS
jgi:ATP-dependent DNA helicase RecG